MSGSCVYCHRDQGRRSCPALGGLISPSCCGKHRGVSISCPPHCKFFKEHEEYQRSRLAPAFHEAWLTTTRKAYQQQKGDLLNWLLLLEVSIFDYFRSQTRGTDTDILEALQFVKQKLSPITIIEAAGSGLSQSLWESAQEFLKANPAADREILQEGTQILHDLILSQALPEEPRHALHGLLGHAEHFIGVPKELTKPATKKAIETPPKIILPGS